MSQLKYTDNFCKELIYNTRCAVFNISGDNRDLLDTVIVHNPNGKQVTNITVKHKNGKDEHLLLDYDYDGSDFVWTLDNRFVLYDGDKIIVETTTFNDFILVTGEEK